LYQITVSNRDEVLLALNSANIFPGVHYRDNTDYGMYAYAKGTCPEAARFSSTVLSLPLHLRMTKSDAERIGETLVGLLGRKDTATAPIRERFDHHKAKLGIVVLDHPVLFRREIFAHQADTAKLTRLPDNHLECCLLDSAA
jgi:hypothetical protein